MWFAVKLDAFNDKPKASASPRRVAFGLPLNEKMLPF
jgi:hypothetical protein